jgi:hypothetical protein
VKKQMNSILGVTVSGIALAISLSTQAATVNSRIITDSTGSQLTQQGIIHITAKMRMIKKQHTSWLIRLWIT